MTDRVNLTAGEPWAELVDDPGCLVPVELSDPAVKWVRLPPELGGERAAILGRFEAVCSQCSAVHLFAALPHDLAVCECSGRFLWFTRRAREQARKA